MVCRLHIAMCIIIITRIPKWWSSVVWLCAVEYTINGKLEAASTKCIYIRNVVVEALGFII